MDKFLEIIYANQIEGETGDKYMEFFAPFLDSLKKIVSEEIYNDLMEKFYLCALESNGYYSVQGMKLAIGVIDGTYSVRA